VIGNKGLTNRAAGPIRSKLLFLNTLRLKNFFKFLS
jgi:hypothetical protein